MKASDCIHGNLCTAHGGPYRVADGTHAHASPYRSCWLEYYYNLVSRNLYGTKVSSESEWRTRILREREIPELMIMGNFSMERAAILSTCRELGINTVHGEDGFFPHYTTMHADPLGFCWESSLSRMTFRECTSLQRKCAQEARTKWTKIDRPSVPDMVKKPFVFWPLQVIGDQVNKCDLNIKGWTPLLRHFRSCLASEFQLVIKEHPRSKPHDNVGLDELLAECPGIIKVPRDTDLKGLLASCCGVAGANSSVLYGARLMFYKPTFTYARGWYTNHEELFMPVTFGSRQIPCLDRLEGNLKIRGARLDDYADWFLAQLLARQISRDRAQSDPAWYKKRVTSLSYTSFLKYGEEIFLDALENGI